MNERIRELAEQAEGTKKHVPAVWQFYDHELVKFAELIVRECANVSVRTGALNEADFEGEMIADSIKEYFGSKELKRL